MKAEEYISSGILELYVLNQLTTSQKAEVEKYALTRPEIAKEIEQIEIALETFALAEKRTANPKLKNRILNAMPEEDTRQLKPRPTKSFNYKILAVAASLLFLISLGINFYQSNQLKQTNSELNDLISEKQFLADQNQQFKAKYETAEDKVKLFQNPDINNIIIKGSELSPESYAFVSYNTLNKKVSISGINLPEPTAEMQYQLWALVDGNPIDLGVFDTQGEIMEMLNTVENPDAFAVTLEEKGGKPTPNLEQLYLIGNVNSKTS